MNLESNEQSKRKRKMLLFLPLLVLPFFALAFWALGGGKKETSMVVEGINGELPGAKISDDKDMDKMAFYDKAAQSHQNKDIVPDSGNTTGVTQPGNDPSLLPATSLTGNMTSPYDYSLNQGGSWPNGNYSESSTENRIRSRLQDIQQQLREREAENQNNNDALNGVGNSNGIDKLNGILQTAEKGEADPEMEQLQEMMKRIYDIQHPELVKEELRKQSTISMGIVYPIGMQAEETPVTLLLPSNIDSLKLLQKLYTNGFYGLENITDVETGSGAGIAAIIQDDISIVNGATVKMGLLQGIYVNGKLIPKGNFINGKASITDDRIIIEINSILHHNSLYKVKLSVYDMDGMEGIYVQGTITRDVTRQSGNDAIQSIGIGSLDPSITAQATAAGIETAKSLLSRKIKLTKVFIKAGHRVLLKDNNQQ